MKTHWFWRALAGVVMAVVQASSALAQAPSADRTVLTRFHSPSFGDPAAKVEIVEFFDPACEACRTMYPTAKASMSCSPRSPTGP